MEMAGYVISGLGCHRQLVGFESMDIPKKYVTRRQSKQLLGRRNFSSVICKLFLLCTEGQPPYYSLASPAYETLAPSHMIHHTDPLGEPQTVR